jgi:hypothetical protein
LKQNDFPAIYNPVIGGEIYFIFEPMLKRKITIVCFLFFLICPLSVHSQMELLTVGTAKTIPHGFLEISLFRPARYGLTKTLELSAQPLIFPIFPNAQIKKNWYDKKFSIATVHGINYPTWLLNMVRKRDRKDLIPRDSLVPQLFVFKNEVIGSTMLKKATSCEAANYFLSVKLGTQFALKFKKSTLPDIEKPVIYPRTSVYHNTLLWYVGVDLDAHLNEFINYCVDIDFLSVGLKIDDWAIEHKGMLMMKLTKSLMVLAGYKVSYGTMPSGNKFGIYPMVDISWTYEFKKVKAKQLDLYDPINKF